MSGDYSGDLQFYCSRITCGNCLCSLTYMVTVKVILLNKKELDSNQQRTDLEMGLSILLCLSQTFPWHLAYTAGGERYVDSWKQNHTINNIEWNNSWSFLLWPTIYSNSMFPNSWSFLVRFRKILVNFIISNYFKCQWLNSPIKTYKLTECIF